MGVNPVALLAVILLTLTFEGLLFGEEIAERAFPSFEQPTSGGFFGALEAILAIVQAVWGGVVFFFELITFDIPGVPWYIRVPVGGILSGGLIYSIILIIRGGGAST